MRHALDYGQRTVMLHEGQVILDVAGVGAHGPRRARPAAHVRADTAAKNSTTTSCCWPDGVGRPLRARHARHDLDAVAAIQPSPAMARGSWRTAHRSPGGSLAAPHTGWVAEHEGGVRAYLAGYPSVAGKLTPLHGEFGSGRTARFAIPARSGCAPDAAGPGAGALAGTPCLGSRGHGPAGGIRRWCRCNPRWASGCARAMRPRSPPAPGSRPGSPPTPASRSTGSAGSADWLSAAPAAHRQHHWTVPQTTASAA